MSDTLVLRGYMPRERAATSALFLMNGYIVGNWAPKIPLFKAALGIDEAMLGLLILAFGIGSLAFMPVVGAIIAREGSRRVLLALATRLSIGRDVHAADGFDLIVEQERAATGEGRKPEDLK